MNCDFRKYFTNRTKNIYCRQ